MDIQNDLPNLAKIHMWSNLGKTHTFPNTTCPSTFISSLTLKSSEMPFAFFFPQNCMLSFLLVEKIHFPLKPWLHIANHCPWQKVHSKIACWPGISRRMSFLPCHFALMKAGFIWEHSLHQKHFSYKKRDTFKKEVSIGMKKKNATANKKKSYSSVLMKSKLGQRWSSVSVLGWLFVNFLREKGNF